MGTPLRGSQGCGLLESAGKMKLVVETAFGSDFFEGPCAIFKEFAGEGDGFALAVARRWLTGQLSESLSEGFIRNIQGSGDLLPIRGLVKVASQNVHGLLKPGLFGGGSGFAARSHSKVDEELLELANASKREGGFPSAGQLDNGFEPGAPEPDGFGVPDRVAFVQDPALS